VILFGDVVMEKEIPLIAVPAAPTTRAEFRCHYQSKTCFVSDPVQPCASLLGLR
jgi:hypothetical protein